MTKVFRWLIGDASGRLPSMAGWILGRKHALLAQVAPTASYCGLRQRSEAALLGALVKVVTSRGGGNQLKEGPLAEAFQTFQRNSIECCFCPNYHSVRSRFTRMIRGRTLSLPFRARTC